MSEAKHDIGLVTDIKAEALGEPGSRRFRLLLKGPGGNACLWLEKNQLFQLSLVIQQILEPEAWPSSSGEAKPEIPEHFSSDQSTMEFEIGNISLWHDSEKDVFLVQTNSTEGDEEDEEESALAFWASGQQLEHLANQAQAVCAAGRPLCPLCSAPMGPEGHVCPKADGHYNI